MLIAHLSDPHVKLPGRLAYGRVDTAAMLEACVADLLRLTPAPDLVVITGDLTDQGQAGEYAHLRQILAPLPQPLVVIPGNHDNRVALGHAFQDLGYLPPAGFLHFALEDWPLRLIGLDTLVPGSGGGALCAERLAWLEENLAREPAKPTLLLMHHPPFATGIAHMDRIGLAAPEAFAALMARHPQVEALLCGHVHRMIHARVGGRPALVCPSPAHQVALDLTPNGPSGFRLEPPGYLLHRWHQGQLVSHQAFVGDFPGPHPFFGNDGRLID
mgnify:CR=1 FL=1